MPTQKKPKDAGKLGGGDPTKQTLIIYETDEVSLFVVPNSEITEEQLRLLGEAHKRYVNSDDMNEGMQWLSNALSRKKEYCSEGDPSQWCIWRDYRVTSKPLTFNIDRIVESGFLP